jgi:hypothetical protein
VVITYLSSEVIFAPLAGTLLVGALLAGSLLAGSLFAGVVLSADLKSLHAASSSGFTSFVLAKISSAKQTNKKF